MKTLAIVLILLVSFGCKKSNQPQGVQVQVSGLPANQTISIHATDANGTILDVKNQTGNSFTTQIVNSGDKVTFLYSLSATLSTDVILKFYYKNQQIGGTGFNSSGTITTTVP